MKHWPAVLAVAVTAATATAQEPPHTHGEGGHRLGTVAWPNSGAPAAQEPFLRGIALLHSFEYTDAAEAFREAQAVDPGFALAYWTEALTNTQLMWGIDDAVDARETMGRLGASPPERLSLAGTEREREFGAAVEAFYAEADVAIRARGFADSLRAMVARDPADLEAAAFASVALLMSLYVDAFPADQEPAIRAEAAALADRVFRANPDHPGAAHYLIHAYDEPELAPRGLEAARAYAAIAPDAEHALHMPSHVFVQVGAWADAAASNERAWAASRAWAERRGASPTELDFHSLEWLQYAYLQQGRIALAASLVDSARSVLSGVDFDSGGFPDARFVVPRLEFALAVHTGRWESWQHDAPMDPGPSASARERSFVRVSAYQAAAGRAMAGESAAAEVAAARLRGLASGTPGAGGFLALQLDALALAAGDREAAIAGLERAAAAEDEVPPVGPPSYLPTHELLGAALLEAGRASDAAVAYQRALERRPNRSVALLGLARALSAAGDSAGARAAYDRLLTNWAHSDPDLPEIAEARAGASGVCETDSC